MKMFSFKSLIVGGMFTEALKERIKAYPAEYRGNVGAGFINQKPKKMSNLERDIIKVRVHDGIVGILNNGIYAFSKSVWIELDLCCRWRCYFANFKSIFKILSCLYDFK